MREPGPDVHANADIGGLVFARVPYGQLNSRQQENYNFQKVAARMADYGFNCLRLTDDWQGADFVACHIDGETFLKVQLKGRFCIDRKYAGKNIYIAFLDQDDCYVYPHDAVMNLVDAADKINGSKSWAEFGAYSWPSIPKWVHPLISSYKI